MADTKDPGANVGRNVARLRRRAGLTGQELAHLAGVSPGSISKIERGTGGVTLKTLQRLAGALRVSPGRLVERQAAKEAVHIRGGRVRGGYKLSEGSDARLMQLGAIRSSAVVCEASIVSLPEQGAKTPIGGCAGAVFVFVLKGFLAYYADGENHFVRPGDHLLFDGVAPHGPACVAEGGARLLVLVSERAARAAFGPFLEKEEGSQVTLDTLIHETPVGVSPLARHE